MQNNSLTLYNILLDLSKQNTAVSVFSFPLVKLFIPVFSFIMWIPASGVELSEGFLFISWRAGP